jgi:hypothetical protein
MEEENDMVNENQAELKQSFASLLKDLQEEKQQTYFDIEELYKRISSHCELAEGHIANNISLKKRDASKYNALKNKPAVMTSIREDKVTPLELVNYLTSVLGHMSEINDWERMKYEALNLFLRKLYNAYMTTKSFEIEKEVTRGFQERQKEWMDLTKSLIENKFENLNTRILSVVKSIEQLKSANESKYFVLNEKMLKMQNQTLKYIAKVPVSKEDLELSDNYPCDFCGIGFSTPREKQEHEKVCKDILMDIDDPNATEVKHELPPQIINKQKKKTMEGEIDDIDTRI